MYDLYKLLSAVNRHDTNKMRRKERPVAVASDNGKLEPTHLKYAIRAEAHLKAALLFFALLQLQLMPCRSHP